MIDLSIIIVNLNTKKLTRECLDSVVKFTKGIDFEFIVIDNASKDGSVEMLNGLIKTLPLKLIVNRDNRGFGQANNQGMKIARGRYLLLLNSDTVVKDNVLGEMVAWMDNHPKVGVSSSALRNADGSFQGTGGYFPTLFRVFNWMFFIEDLPFISKIIKVYHPMHPDSPFYKGEEFFTKAGERDWLTGAYFLFKREVFGEVGLFDRDYFMYVEELDYCYRAKKKGWQVWYLPNWDITHYGGASGTSEFALLSEYKGIKTFYKKHFPAWQLPVVRIMLKLGALARMFIFGPFKGLGVIKIYAKAFSVA